MEPGSRVYGRCRKTEHTPRPDRGGMPNGRGMSTTMIKIHRCRLRKLELWLSKRGIATCSQHSHAQDVQWLRITEHRGAVRNERGVEARVSGRTTPSTSHCYISINSVSRTNYIPYRCLSNGGSFGYRDPASPSSRKAAYRELEDWLLEVRN